MNATELSKKAALSTAPYAGALSDQVCHKLELAYVAQWLAIQDDDVGAAAAFRTARAAIAELRAVYNRNHA